MDVKFLLENTQEAETERAKIIDLLLLQDTENQVLGLSILEGGGVHASMWTALISLYTFSEDSEVQKRLSNLLGNNETYWEIINHLEDYTATTEEWENLLKSEAFFLEHNFLDKKQMALFGLFHQKIGLNYCLENKILNTEIALGLFLENDHLDLSDTQLTTLPKEVGKFKNITYLDIDYNHFTDIPDELVSLKKLQTIYHTYTPLSEDAIRKLETFFPKIYAEKYHNQAGTAYTNKNREEAETKIKRVLELNPEVANYWITKSVIVAEFEENYEKAIELLHKVIEVAKEEVKISQKGEILTLAWANISAYYHRSGQNQTALWAADKGFQVYQNYPQTTVEWEETLYFRKGQALFHMGNLEDSLQVYQKGLGKYPNKNSMLYNIACIYARWKEKEKMLNYLQKAIDIYSEHKEEASKDLDFEKYWQDEDFLALVKS